MNTMSTMQTSDIMYKRIRALRKREHITQFDMAERLGISRRTYANYERGIHSMPVDTLIVIADLFGTSLDYLAGRTPDRQEGFLL
jgi:transcriptional regulator with XRE-family HTH domain